LQVLLQPLLSLHAVRGLDVITVGDARIPSLVPPATRPPGQRPQPSSTSTITPLPLAVPPERGSLRYGLGRIDASGRVTDKLLLSCLGWTPGQRLSITVVGTAAVICPHSAGVFTLTSAHFLVLSAPIRRRCGLRLRDQVLLVADPGQQVLVAHPCAALDPLITAYHAQLLGGGDDDGESR
jgi:hypothetical protein